MEEENLQKNVLKNNIEEITNSIDKLSLEELKDLKEKKWKELSVLKAVIEFKRDLKEIK